MLQSNILPHFIEGRFQPIDASGVEPVFDVTDPEDDRPLYQCARADSKLIERAVNAAAVAFTSFRGGPPDQRQEILLNAAELLFERRQQFEEVLLSETGSPVLKARREVETSIRLLKAAASIPKQIRGETCSSDDPNRLSYSVREPLGVIAGFTPFNVPLIKTVKLTAMALATANCVVLLPSEKAPRVSIMMAQLFHDAGLPPGCCNVIGGVGAEVGDVLTEAKHIKAVSFTGSTTIGRHVAALCGKHRKRVVLEMGGQNPLIVLSDADLQAAVQAAIPGSFLFQGQICMASSRVILHEAIAEPFLQAFVSAASQLKVGDLKDPQTMIGPIIDAASRQRLQGLIDDAIQKGATVRCGNQWQGHRLIPTILTNVTSDMKIWQEETFGPIAVVRTASSSTDALQLANDTNYGLCAAVFTNRLDQAIEFSRQLECGMVHVNEGTILEESEVPFGGIGDSGFGREGTTASVDSFTEWKWITVKSIPSA